MLNIRSTHALMGKLANNLEKHGEEDVTVFDTPISGITLSGEEFCALQEDPYADRWLFDHKADVREPNLAKFKPLEWLATFEDATVVLTCGDDEFTFTGVRIKGVTFDGQRGGDVMLAFDVRLRPETDAQILQLIAHQNRPIKIDVQDAKVALKGGRKQQELPLSQAASNDGGEHPDPDAEELTHPEQLFEDNKPKRKRGRPRNSERTAH